MDFSCLAMYFQANEIVLVQVHPVFIMGSPPLTLTPYFAVCPIPYHDSGFKNRRHTRFYLADYFVNFHIYTAKTQLTAVFSIMNLMLLCDRSSVFITRYHNR
jgi:hypothetical protein